MSVYVVFSAYLAGKNPGLGAPIILCEFVRLKVRIAV